MSPNKIEIPRSVKTEHDAIHATLKEATRNDLALHAQTEEELLYPAAILVGDIIRARLGST